MPQTEARPPAENRHGGAPKGARPTLLDAGRFASARACRVMVCPTGCRCTRAPVGAPPTLRGGDFISPTRARSRRGNESCCSKVARKVSCEMGKARKQPIDPADALHARAAQDPALAATLDALVGRLRLWRLCP